MPMAKAEYAGFWRIHAQGRKLLWPKARQAIYGSKIVELA
jgi:hypothetical protein